MKLLRARMVFLFFALGVSFVTLAPIIILLKNFDKPDVKSASYPPEKPTAFTTLDGKVSGCGEAGEIKITYAGVSGIHTYAAKHDDIVHNTACPNSHSPVLSWCQIWAGARCRDIIIINTVWQSQAGKPVNFGLGKLASEILNAHNLVYGEGDNDGEAGGGLGSDGCDTAATELGNLFADPLFVKTALAQADFHPQLDSQANGLADLLQAGVRVNDLA